MANRIDGRKPDEIRELKIKRKYISHTDGSVFIEAGNTRIICTATVEDRVPPFLKGKGRVQNFSTRAAALTCAGHVQAAATHRT